jgi:uncharacterized membrane protein
MSHGLYLWVKAFHILGVVVWAGAMIALGSVLVAIGRANPAGREAAIAGGMATARLMDVGALVAIACGIWVIVGTKASLGAQWALKQPWMHIKLTLVVVALLTTHAVLRIKLGKYRRNAEPKPLPGFVVPVVLVVVAAIVVLAVAHPIGG